MKVVMEIVALGDKWKNSRQKHALVNNSEAITVGKRIVEKIGTKTTNRQKLPRQIA